MDLIKQIEKEFKFQVNPAIKLDKKLNEQDMLLQEIKSIYYKRK